MNEFKEFTITKTSKVFEGSKINMSKYLDQKIIVYAYKIEDSKCFKDRGTCKCLHLQISLNDEKHIIFTSSRYLIDDIKQIPEDKFPFSTTIVMENKMFKFT